MAYRGQGQVAGRPMDGGDPRTPMAWQHRDQVQAGRAGRPEARASPGRNGGYSYREGGHTPASRRAKSQERYSRSQSREREGGRGRAFRSQPSPSTTEGTAEDTTETDTVEREGSEYQHGQQM